MEIMKLDAQVSFRTSSEIKAKIESLAREAGKKPSQIINELLVRALETSEQPQKHDEVLSLETMRQTLLLVEQRMSKLEQELEGKFAA
ncbi:hypothetical protein GXM_09506 [Nostoc sphaeroides CCNUC1]|uniref:Ribbon-helix-helix protein CopG domain-containing protein n=2 Tax=Nostoc sphaeroides TaxID=446679 RepID=A0A5P8WHU2_9NOSO|nr:hypothetical protein GXM_09506 [Nostoc sphaeroides CCNUC1]